MDPEDELFSDPPDALLVTATVGEVINLDSISQDSVPLDDTVSQGTDTSQEAAGIGKEEDVTADRQMESTEEVHVQEDKVGSPKPFDASLFGETKDIVHTASEGDFPIQTPLPTASSGADKTTEDTPVKEDSSSLGSLHVNVEVKRQSSVDGFESQPIGSPGAHFQFSDSGPFGEISPRQSLGTKIVTAGEQPAISSFFKEEDVVSVGDTEGKSFFDSFTSGGDGFPGPGSIDTPHAEEDNRTMIPSTGTSEVNLLEPLGQDLLSSPSHDMKGSTEEISLANGTSSKTSQDVTSNKQTLLELSEQSASATLDNQATFAKSGEQTLTPHSPLPEVTSPHLCSVQDQGEGESFKVAFSKNDSTASEPRAVDTQVSPTSERQEPLSPVEPRQQPPPQQYTPPPQPPPRLFSPSHSGEDTFAAAISTSQSDRRHDAWLPSSATLKVLANRMSALQGTEYVDRAQLTMPGVILEDPQVSKDQRFVHN